MTTKLHFATELAKELGISDNELDAAMLRVCRKFGTRITISVSPEPNAEWSMLRDFNSAPPPPEFANLYASERTQRLNRKRVTPQAQPVTEKSDPFEKGREWLRAQQKQELFDKAVQDVKKMTDAEKEALTGLPVPKPDGRDGPPKTFREIAERMGIDIPENPQWPAPGENDFADITNSVLAEELGTKAIDDIDMN